MIQARAWPARAMYILVAAALAISLFITAAPAQKVSGDCTADVCAEWEMVDTPSMEGFVLAPESMIIDYALAEAGEVAYAVVEAYDEECGDGPTDMEYRLLKSDDYAATWDDITEALEDMVEDELPVYLSDEPDDDAIVWMQVATDWEDPDFVAVAMWLMDYNSGSQNYYLYVAFSTDGGDSFEDAGEVEDGGVYLTLLSDLAVSYENGGDREIVIGGIDDSGDAGLFRCTVTGDDASSWEDATTYDGWDDDADFDSELVTDIIFSPNWATDKTILVTTVTWVEFIDPVDYFDVHMQCASFGTSEGWNEWSTLGIEAVPIVEHVELPMWLVGMDARGIAGLTLPEDYNSKNSDDRILWAWVNYYDSAGAVSGPPMCALMRVDDDSADPVGPMGQIEDGELWLTNVSYHGTIAEGEAIAGVMGDGTGNVSECCEGVQVYRNDGIRNMDICCERWHDACKPPTGETAMAVSYVDDDKAYAVALQGFGDYDEGAWSVTFDDGDTWNQLSLIDTDIEYISDVAVSPDCNKTFLATVNYRSSCSCDSVWLHAVDLHEAEEYSGQWLRTWCGHLVGWNNQKGDDSDFPFVSRRSLLRLAPEETTGMTVFLVDRMSSNVYWNDMETLACWDPISSTVLDEIVDLVAQDDDTLFALDYNGDVAMFDDDEWQEEVDSKVGNGWTIAVWDNQVLVGGQDGDVSYSADYDDEDEDTFTELEDISGDGAHVTVAFDSYFDENDTVFAALANAGDDNGIYLLVIEGETEEWTKLAAEEHNYTGLVLDRADGNPMTSPETGGVLYASYRGTEYDGWCGYDDFDPLSWDTGVARCLTPIVEICCGAGGDEWSYLTWDLCPDDGGCADFRMTPQALKICGCLTADSNSHLFVIDGDDYDICEGEDGTVWTFEDCYAKKAVEPVSPADGFVVSTDTCECCNAPFAIRWDRLCDACCYEIEFALDEDFTEMFYPYYIMDGDDGIWFDWYCPDEPMDPSLWVGCYFDPEFTYFWRVRVVEAETCQDILSWWSDPMSFTVAPTAGAAAIDLVSPEPGATGVATTDLGFSWDLAATADSFDWVLSKNADLSSPLESATALNATAYECTKALSYSGTYFWQVTAYNEGAAISTSAIGTFTTKAEPQYCSALDGQCFDTQAELEAHNKELREQAMATPPWVWVVIAIGAVLVIVVIVLIFRTRRV